MKTIINNHNKLLNCSIWSLIRKEDVMLSPKGSMHKEKTASLRTEPCSTPQQTLVPIEQSLCTWRN